MKIGGEESAALLLLFSCRFTDLRILCNFPYIRYLKEKISHHRGDGRIAEKSRGQSDFKFSLLRLVMKHPGTDNASHRTHHKCAGKQRALRYPPSVLFRPLFIDSHKAEIKNIPDEIG